MNPRAPVSSLVALCALLVFAGASGAGVSATSLHRNVTPNKSSPDTLPPIPAGVPTYFSYGLFNASTSDLPAGVPLNFRYQYLAGGANTGDGWATWSSPAGQYATDYINSSRSAGKTPAFVYYQILQSAPNYDEYTNLQNASTMRTYYD